MGPDAEWNLQTILIGGRSFETSEDDSDDSARKSATEYGFLFKPSENASENLVSFNEELQYGKETHQLMPFLVSSMGAGILQSLMGVSQSKQSSA